MSTSATSSFTAAASAYPSGLGTTAAVATTTSLEEGAKTASAVGSKDKDGITALVDAMSKSTLGTTAATSTAQSAAKESGKIKATIRTYNQLSSTEQTAAKKAIDAINKVTVSRTKVHYTWEGYTPGILGSLNSHPETFYLASIGNEFVGYADGYKETDDRLLCLFIAVAPQSQRHGIGMDMYCRMLKDYPSIVVPIFEDNIKNNAAMEKLGRLGFNVEKKPGYRIEYTITRMNK